MTFYQKRSAAKPNSFFNHKKRSVRSTIQVFYFLKRSATSATNFFIQPKRNVTPQLRNRISEPSESAITFENHKTRYKFRIFTVLSSKRTSNLLNKIGT